MRPGIPQGQPGAVPAAPKFPSIFYTPIDEIDEVVFDMELLSRGHKLFFVVDAKEVIEFCFPINPFSMREVNLDTIASTQAALYEVFMRREPRPILTPHYAEEIVRHLRFVATNNRRAQEEIELIVNRLKEGVDIEEILADTAVHRLDALQRKFKLYLSAVMGIESMGAVRFQSVVKHLLEVADLPDPVVQEVRKNYQPRLVDRIDRILNEGLDTRTHDEYDLAQRRSAARRDAMVIDWLLYMNRELARRHAAAQTPGPLFLYLSSAPKNERVFDDPEIRKEFPTLYDRQFSFWRRREHLLFFLSAGETIGDDPPPVEQLRSFRNVCAEVQSAQTTLAEAKRQAACSQCALTNGHDESCSWFSLCSRVKQVEQNVRTRSNSMLNLGLIARVQSYSQFLDLHPASKANRDYLKYFQELVKDNGVADLALNRLLSFQQFSQSQAAFAKWTTEAVRTGLGDPDLVDYDRSLPEPRRNLEITFPEVRPPYAEIAQLVFTFHQAGTSQPERAELMRRAVSRFLDEDIRTTGAAPADADHELTRCLLYLSFLGKSGNEKAFNCARKGKTNYPERRIDFLYVMSSAACHLGQYVNAYEVIKEGVSLAPEDPRFHHALANVTFDWLSDEAYARFCPRNAAQAVHDGEKALALYKELGPRYAPMVANLFNNLAYMFVYSPDSPVFRRIYDLDRALKMLVDLQATLASYQWDCDTPEFSHTAALIHYQEATRAGRKGQREEAVQALRKAHEEIRHALSAVAKPLYIQLESDIAAARVKLGDMRKPESAVASHPTNS